MDDTLITELWDVFREFMPEKHKDNAAARYVDWLFAHDVSRETLESIIGYDTHLDDAIQAGVTTENDEYAGYEEDEPADDDWS
jgi:hypothetical protein